MNLVDAYVVRVIGEPTLEWNKWWVPVVYNSWGRESETKIMCNTYEEALAVKPGFKFLT
jgi:hypothetical protein